MADVKVPKLLHKMSISAQKAWYKKQGMEMPSSSEGKSAAQAKKVKVVKKAAAAVKPQSVRDINAARQKAYYEKGGRAPIGAGGSGGSNSMAGVGMSNIKQIKAAIKAGVNPKVAESVVLEATKAEAEKMLGGPVKEKPKMPPGKQPAGYRYVRGLARKAMKAGLKKEEVEQIEEGFNKSSPAHMKARDLVSRSSMKAVYHSDGSATIHTTGDENVSSATKVDHIHRDAGLDHNKPASAYKNSSKSKGGLTFKTKEADGSHQVHISYKGMKEEVAVDEAKKPDASMAMTNQLRMKAISNKDKKTLGKVADLMAAQKKLDNKNMKEEAEMQYIEEKLTAADPASKWISDFVKSDNPKFAGKSKKERIQQALGAYYAAKRGTNEEVEQIDEGATHWEYSGTVNGKDYSITVKRGGDLSSVSHKSIMKQNPHLEPHEAKAVHETSGEDEEHVEVEHEGKKYTHHVTNHQEPRMVYGEEVEQIDEKYMGFKKLKAAIAAKGGARNPAAVAAAGKKMSEEVEQVDEQSPAEIKAKYYHDQFNKVKPVKAYDKEGKLVGRYRSMDHAKQMKPGHTYKVEEEVEQVDEVDMRVDMRSGGFRTAAARKLLKHRQNSNKPPQPTTPTTPSMNSEALDPVGREDKDINNDSKVDKTDVYLHSKRKAIGAAIRDKLKKKIGK